MTAEIKIFEPRRAPAKVGPIPARLDNPRVRPDGPRGPVLSATLNIHLASVPLIQRQTLTQMLQGGRPVSLTLTPELGENPDPAKSNGEGPNGRAPTVGRPD